jgi:putative membrane protein
MTPPSEEALRKAVADIEADSSAELVVVVKTRSASYRHVDLSLGMTCAVACLAFMLYSPWPFAWHFLLLTPVVAAIGVTVLSSKIPALARALSKTQTMHASVQQAARAAFVEAGVHHTEFRSGVLIYVSLLERRVELVADSGVELAIAKEDWDDFAAKAQSAVQEGGGADALASTIASSAELFAKHLPPQDEDINELPDGVID